MVSTKDVQAKPAMKAAPADPTPADPQAPDFTPPRPVPADIDQPAPEPGQPSGYHPPAPGFMAEGTRQEIELYGEARDPYTGKRLTRDDLP